MNLQLLNTICFAVAIVCVVIGSVLAISMIWMEYPNDVLYRSWATIGVVFLASVITLIVSKAFGSRMRAVP